MTSHQKSWRSKVEHFLSCGKKKKGKPLNQSQMDVKEGKTIFHKRKVRELVTDEPEIKEMLMGVLQAEGNDTE